MLLEGVGDDLDRAGKDAGDVETDRRGADSGGVDEGGGEAADAELLVAGDGLGGVAEAETRAALHLADHQVPSLADDQVELASTTVTPVPGHQPVTRLLVPRQRRVLAARAEALAGMGHLTIPF